MSTLPSSPETGLGSGSTIETKRLIVEQPPKVQALLEALEAIESIPMRVSERTGEDISADLGAAGAGAGARRDDRGVSPRDQAIANLPQPATMQKQLEQHIHAEVRTLSRRASSIARASGPGAAHRLNQLYARIRRLNALITELLEASYEVLKRLFIRVFIDNQPIL
jgi:hypothetical protein